MNTESASPSSFKFKCSRRAEIPESATLYISDLVRARKNKNLPVYDLGGGELKEKLAPPIGEEIKQAVDDGDTGYTPTGGTDALKDAVGEMLMTANGVRYNRNEIIGGAGGKGIISTAILASVDPGDAVIVVTPAWVSYVPDVLLAEGVPSYLHTSAEDGFKINPKALRQVLTDNQKNNLNTKWLILNSPNNPTGAVYTEKELEGIAKVLDDFPQTMVMWDQVYKDLVYDDDTPFVSLTKVAPRLNNRILIVDSASKSDAMTGLRIGLGASKMEELIKVMHTLQGNASGNPNSISQRGWTKALRMEKPEYRKKWVEKLKERRDKAYEMLGDIKGVSCHLTKGGFYFFADIGAIIGSEMSDGTKINSASEFATHLLEKTGVAVVPSEGFGGKDPAIRISFATDSKTLYEGLEHIKTFCKELGGVAAAITPDASANTDWNGVKCELSQ